MKTHKVPKEEKQVKIQKELDKGRKVFKKYKINIKKEVKQVRTYLKWQTGRKEKNEILKQKI